MKQITTLYTPHELKTILDIMKKGFDEARLMTSIVIALHKAGYKIIKMDSKNTIDFKE